MTKQDIIYECLILQAEIDRLKETKESLQKRNTFLYNSNSLPRLILLKKLDALIDFLEKEYKRVASLLDLKRFEDEEPSD